MQNNSAPHLEAALTARQCAPLVGTTASMLWRMAEQNLIPCLRTGITGRGIRFIPSEVLAALKSRPAWVDPASSRRGKKKADSGNAQ
jgi:predicted DNA-binding transcriptional regulator AlpA